MSTCVACNTSFAEGEDRASHYASEFHVLNTKRRAAELPPLTRAGWARVQAARAAAADAAADADADVLYVCEACHRSFGSEGAFATHNASRRHAETVRALLAERRAARAEERARAAAGLPPAPPPAPAAAAAEPAELTIGASNCVFCWRECGTVEGALAHMAVAHSFFLPDARRCVAPDALIEYLHGIVIEQQKCVACGGNKQYDSPDAARQHMVDAGHCRMRYADEADWEEFEDFYDYEMAIVSGDEEEGEGEGEGEGDDDDAPDADELRRLAATGGDLRLPGGRVARHKAVARYYSRSYADSSAEDSRAASIRAAMSRVALEYAAAATGRGAKGAHAGLALDARLNLGTGTRGNLTLAAAQRRAQGVAARAGRDSVRVGMNKNMLIRKYFRISADNTGH